MNHNESMTRSWRRGVQTLFPTLGLVILGLILTASELTVLGAEQEAQPQSPATAAPPTSSIDPKLPTAFIAGDSTAASGSGATQGWGVPFAAYFDTAKINVANRARGGRSSRTFQSEGLWDRVLAEMKPGDFVLIQFAHNDGGAINDASRARGSVPGLGEETQEIDNLLTKKHEVVHTFGWYMRKFIADTKARGATPIVLSLTVRNIWKDGRVERGSGRFSQCAAEIAKSQGVTFVDLTNIVADQYQKMGQEKVKEFFPGDHTHTSPAGADFNAASVVAGLKGLNNCPLVGYFSEKGKAIQADVPRSAD
jgi:rhamnogalacturonan acetylesterase